MFATVVQAAILSGIAACLGGPALLIFLAKNKPAHDEREQLRKVRRS